jgi:hypothetical protein
VKPELDVLDYHTEFSGITKEALLPVRLLCCPVCCIVGGWCCLCEGSLILAYSDWASIAGDFVTTPM